MKASNDQIGTENDAWLYKLAREAAIIVAAWGNDGSYLNRSGEILGALLNLHCIKMNKSGEPAHPLYLKADLKRTYGKLTFSGTGMNYHLLRNPPLILHSQTPSAVFHLSCNSNRLMLFIGFS